MTIKFKDVTQIAPLKTVYFCRKFWIYLELF